jgi:hypothetical protein
MLWLGLAAGLLAQEPAGEEGRVRFSAIEIYVDSGSTPLAAYQLEFAATNGNVTISGIEGGDAGVFHEPPLYDPAAMQHERVIIASFSTAPVGELPTGKTRVATIHVRITGAEAPRFDLKLVTAANSAGKKISVESSFEERKAP